MNLADDPAMKEVVDDFCKESIQLISEMQTILEKFEDNPEDPTELENFGQIIDRMMGASKTLGLQDIATFCELGKTIGYKSSQTSDVALLNVVSAVLFDALEMLKKMIGALSSGDKSPLKKINTTAFATRLKWLSEKFKSIERSSVSFTGKKQDLDQKSIDDLINSLGL